MSIGRAIARFIVVAGYAQIDCFHYLVIDRTEWTEAFLDSKLSVGHIIYNLP
ncbi:MAG: hypothetical protein F6K31_08240 [Symploca sp. SIO2G7]|nr:hypothetical protein [Symploca sp. SIO2G7]